MEYGRYCVIQPLLLYKIGLLANNDISNPLKYQILVFRHHWHISVKRRCIGQPSETAVQIVQFRMMLFAELGPRSPRGSHILPAHFFAPQMPIPPTRLPSTPATLPALLHSLSTPTHSQ